MSRIPPQSAGQPAARPPLDLPRDVPGPRHRLPLARRTGTPPAPERPRRLVGSHHQRRRRDTHPPRDLPSSGRGRRDPRHLRRSRRRGASTRRRCASWTGSPSTVGRTSSSPEFPELLSTLGIDTRFQAVINSTASGYEKPHPHAFRLARSAADPAHRLVMIGDNPQADAAGARHAGIDAIWVRRDRHTDTPDLDAAARILLTSEPVPDERNPALHEITPLQPTAPEALPIR
ncbi:HAD-IA family hydrolase [Streptomyces sp. NPDC048606]|uniref:HAD family hydrolase n=1 Tax=Streptomyces sp. NPDC048606 TaxID=3154726 RepID=UPI003432D7E0